MKNKGPNWSTRAVEIDGESFEVEYYREGGVVGVRVWVEDGFTPPLATHDGGGSLDAQVHRLAREILEGE